MGKPDLTFEEAAWAAGHRTVAGVDEVGRGPLAGPVTAAAVVLVPGAVPEGLQDSKKLPAARRETLARRLHSTAEVSVAHATVAEIDALNILRASHLAMVRAVEALPRRPDYLLVDGNLIPAEFSMPAEAIVGGDGRSLSIAAASIVAKVCRDFVMRDLAQHFPGYGWENNAGYPTKSHKQALEKLGATPHHRRSFRPVHNILYQEKNSTS